MWLQQLLYFLLYALAFSIPFPYIYSAVGIALVSAAWILQANFKETFNNLRQRKALWPFIIYFLLIAISYTYSDNKEQSSFDINSKLSFVIIPFVIGAGMSINKKQLERFLLAFVSGITIVSIAFIIKAIFKWQESGSTDVFFYHNLVEGTNANAVYEAWYAFFSISLLMFFPWQQFFSGRLRLLRLAIIVIQLAFFILLSSRMLIALFFILAVPVYITNSLRIAKIGTGKIAILIAVFVLLLISIITIPNPIKKRYDDIFYNSIHIGWIKPGEQVDETQLNNFTLRLFLWQIGIENMNDHQLWLTGAGNGDVPALQNEKMIAHGIKNIHSEKELRSPLYNANLHNMYLQTLLMIGLPGLLIFILITFTPLININKTEYKVAFGAFHISSVLFMMQEAAMQTQAGIMYYILISSIYWSFFYNEKQINFK